MAIRSQIESRDITDEPVPQFVGPYSVLARLSNHKATAVFRCYDKASQRDVCIKRLTEVGAASNSSIAAMEREYTLGKRLQHPGLVEMLAYDTSTPRHYFVMEYFAPGATLLNVFLQADPPFKLKLKPVLVQMLETLAYIHSQSIVHRDIKPDNVLVNPDGRIKVIDLSVAFEMAQRLPAWRRLLGLRHKVVGTRTYMPPEQIEGRDVDGRADLYAFGVMMFELLAGRAPFLGKDPDDLLRMHLRETPPSLAGINPAVTTETSQFVGRLLSKDPGLRPQRCEDVLYFLRRHKLLRTDNE